MIGFYCFTQPPVIVEPTMKEKIAGLTEGQRSDILKYFANQRSPQHAARELGMNRKLVEFLYEQIDAVQQRCRAYMRGEVVITPAVVDEEGNITTPAVMNTPPTSGTELRDAVRPEFTEYITVAMFGNTVTAIIKNSKYDGTGAFAFYASEIVK